MIADGEAAQHCLADDAERQQHADDRQITAERAAPEREQPGGGGDDPTSPESIRLPNSIQACVSSGGATLP